MNRKRAPGFFVTGSNTDVGKTYVAALIARELIAAGLRVGVYKPVASGCERRDGKLTSDDAETLWEAAGRPAELERVCPLMFAAPLSPPVAARREGKAINFDALLRGFDFWAERSDVVIVEGAGGLMSPISDDFLVADLGRELCLPYVIVANNVLGAVHQSLATSFVARNYRFGQPIAALVLNDPTGQADESQYENFGELHRRFQKENVDRPEHLTVLGRNAKHFVPPVDWRSLSRLSN